MIPDRNDMVTRLLTQQDRAASEQLLPLVYDQLRRLAQQRMGEERAAHTLQATALVHEAYIRLVGDADISWENRGHFFAAAAEAMRRILIEHARSRGREKRGGIRERVPISVVDLAVSADTDEILSLDEAICRMEEEDASLASVVRLRFYAGLSVEETAQALGVGTATVKRRWAFARAWLFKAMGGED